MFIHSPPETGQTVIHQNPVSSSVAEEQLPGGRNKLKEQEIALQNAMKKMTYQITNLDEVETICSGDLILASPDPSKKESENESEDEFDLYEDVIQPGSYLPTPYPLGVPLAFLTMDTKANLGSMINHRFQYKEHRQKLLKKLQRLRKVSKKIALIKTQLKGLVKISDAAPEEELTSADKQVLEMVKKLQKKLDKLEKKQNQLRKQVKGEMEGMKKESKYLNEKTDDDSIYQEAKKLYQKTAEF